MTIESRVAEAVEFAIATLGEDAPFADLVDEATEHATSDDDGQDEGRSIDRVARLVDRALWRALNS